MTFPLYFLEQLRERINIVDLINSSVRLQRRGAEWIGLCPFHPEKTPSFHVVPDKQFYHCFGCGAHGDGLKFLREHHNLPFLEAVKELAEMAGMDMPDRDPERQKHEDQREQQVNVMDQAAAWFHQQLFGPQGAEARAMLEDRGISSEMIAQFQLGFAPNDANLMMSALKLPVVEARQLGLIKSGERGDYTFFRQRLMFPIRDVRGQTIAFGGRRVREDQPAKYMNSPDTPLFTKRQQLYNLAQAKRPVRQGHDLLVVEGYMDVIALVQADFPAAVAPLGTALTAEQLGRLWQYHDSPTLCFDGDIAGQKAALRVAHEAIRTIVSGKGLCFVFLPVGEDPDSLIRQHGRGAMAQLLAESMNLGAFLWQSLAAEAAFDQPESVSQIKKQCDELAASNSDPYMRSSYRQYWRDQIWQAQRGAGQKSGNAKNGIATNYSRGKAQKPAAPKTAPRTPSDQISARIILAAMLHHPDLIEEFAEAFSALEFPEHLDKLRQKLHMFPPGSVHSTEDASQALMSWLHQEYQHQTALKQVLSREVYTVAPEVGPQGSIEQARELLVRLGMVLHEQCLIEDGQRMYREAMINPAVLDRLRLLQQEIQDLRRSGDVT